MLNDVTEQNLFKDPPAVRTMRLSAVSLGPKVNVKFKSKYNLYVNCNISKCWIQRLNVSLSIELNPEPGVGGPVRCV